MYEIFLAVVNVLKPNHRRNRHIGSRDRTSALNKNKSSVTSKTFILSKFQIRLWINDNPKRL